jgi:hypothetical protein
MSVVVSLGLKSAITLAVVNTVKPINIAADATVAMAFAQLNSSYVLMQSAKQQARDDHLDRAGPNPQIAYGNRQLAAEVVDIGFGRHVLAHFT